MEVDVKAGGIDEGDELWPAFTGLEHRPLRVRLTAGASMIPRNVRWAMAWRS